MKKSEQIDLSIPQRQSILAIIFIILKFLRAFIGQAWIIIIPLFLGRGNSFSSGWETWELAVAGMGVFSAIWSVIAYFRYYYSLSDEELIIQKGILRKTDVNVPYERIQSVNFKQNFLHQILNVTEVAIDTAGSGEKEIQIDALTLQNAKTLRAEILRRKKNEASEAYQDQDEEIVVENILTLTNTELFKVGLTQNHFKPVGLIVGLIFSSFAYSWQLDIEPQDIMRNIYSFLEDRSFLQSIGIAVLLVIFSVIYSIVTTFLNHANLSFFRNDDKFQLNQGLLTRKEVAAVDRKIQYISWGQNILQRLLGFYQLSFQQAGANAVKQRIKNNFRIPGCTEDKIDFVKSEWLGKVENTSDQKGVSIHYFYYSLRWIVGLFGLAIAANLFFDRPKTGIFLVLLMIYSVYVTWLSYRKKKYAINSKHVQISGGGLGFKHLLMPTYKIQNVAIQQSPYQWRRKLASLRIYTAAGALEIPFISEERASKLMDRLLYDVERSNKPWM
jgi:putative membrane protein